MISKEEKHAILWNVLDPDDPYDIRRSMIARLPDHPTRPMTQHLQLVCLLQAAEIERLTDYLSQMKSKYREIERRELDRHSYEVQIKEILEKNYQSSNLKSENEKLKDFIRRQQLQLQELQKRGQQSANLQTLQAKYQGLLHELQIARDQKEYSEKNVVKLGGEVAQWKSRWERSERQKNGLSSQFELQMKERLNNEIKSIRQKSDDRIDKLTVQSRQLREMLDGKNQEIKTLQLQKQQFSKEIRLLQDKCRTKANIEDVMADKNREVQRLSALLNQKTVRLEQTLNQLQLTGGELRLLEDRVHGEEKERDMLILKLREMEGVRARHESMDKLEEKVVMMSMEIERLNGLNNIRSRELAESTGELQRLKMQLRGVVVVKQQAQRDRQRVLKLQMELQVLQPNEAKISLLSQQLERVNFMLKAKSDELLALQQRTKISQGNAAQLAGLTAEKSRLEQQLQASRIEMRNFRTITESEIGSLKGENFKLRQEVEQSYASRSEYQKYRGENDRLRVEVQKVRAQWQQMRRSVQQQRDLVLKIEGQQKRMLKQNQRVLKQNQSLRIEISHLRQDGQNVLQLQRNREQKEKLLIAKDIEIGVLQKKMIELNFQLDEGHNRNVELSDSIERIYQEIERLHNLLAGKTADLQKVVKENILLEEKCRFYENKFNNNVGEKDYYEKEITRLKSDSQVVIKRINEVQGLLQQRNREIGEHIKENESLERKIIEVQRELATKINSQEPLRKEYERVTKLLQAKDARMREVERIIKENQTVSREADAKAKMWELRVGEWENRLQQTEVGLQSSQAQTDRLKRENQQLRKRIQEMNKQERNRVQEQSIRLQLQLCEQALNRQRKQSQTLRARNRTTQDSLLKQNLEIESLRNSVKEYQMKIVHIENTNSRVINERSREDQQRLQERDNLIVNLQKQIKQMENQLAMRDSQFGQSRNRYEQNIAMLSVELQRLKGALQQRTNQSREKDRVIEQLRARSGEGQDSSDAERYRIEITNLQTALQELQNINFHTAAERDELFQVSHELKDQLDDHIHRSSEELKMLRSELQAKIQEIRRYGEELGSLKMRQQTFLLKIQSLEENLGRNSEAVLLPRIAELQKVIELQRRQINDLQLQNANFLNEIHRLQGSMNSGASIEVAHLQNRIQQLMLNQQAFLALQEKYTLLYDAYKQLYSNYHLEKNQHENAKAELATYQAKIYQLQQQFENLTQALRAIQAERDQYKREIYELRVKNKDDGDLYNKNLVLSRQIDRLTEENAGMRGELSEMRLRATNEMSLQKRIEEQLGLLVVLFAQIQSLRSRVQFSERECEEVRRSSLSPYRVDHNPRG